MVPPYFASGAGAEMRRSVGTAMLWGAFGVTLFGIFLTPVFFYVVRWFSDRGPVKPALAARARRGAILDNPGCRGRCDAKRFRYAKTRRLINITTAVFPKQPSTRGHT